MCRWGVNYTFSKLRKDLLKIHQLLFFCAMISIKSNSIENDDVPNPTVESDSGYLS